jgi:hypothetical protein
MFVVIFIFTFIFIFIFCRSIKNGWDQIKNELDGIVAFHSSFSVSLKKEIVAKLEAYLLESEPRKKQVTVRTKVKVKVTL